MEPAINAFKEGDIVRLKSGGPKMTYSSKTAGSEMICCWFPDENAPKFQQFRPQVLIKVQEGDAGQV